MTKNEVQSTLDKIGNAGFEYAVTNWQPKRDPMFKRLFRAYEAAAEDLASYIKAEAARHGVEYPDET